VPSNPAQLLIDRETSFNTFNQYTIDPIYLPLLVSNQPTLCPVIDLDLLDNSGNVLNDLSVFMTGKDLPENAVFDVRNDVAFTMDVRIKGLTMSLDAYMTLNIRVCGEEVLTVVDATKKFYLNAFNRGNPLALSTADRFFQVP